MVSPLEGLIRKQIGKGLGPVLIAGTLRRDNVDSVTAAGDPVVTTYQTYAFKGIRQDFTAFYRQQAGIPDTDVKILILADSIAVQPQKDDWVNIPDKFNGGAARWHRVRKVLEIDPATASYLLQAFVTNAPTPP